VASRQIWALSVAQFELFRLDEEEEEAKNNGFCVCVRLHF
jgi:hypothetical protein